jgi:hypothetical protein
MIIPVSKQAYNAIAAQKFFYWGKFGVGINANLYEQVLEPISRGLKILVSRVQVSFLASSQFLKPKPRLKQVGLLV